MGLRTRASVVGRKDVGGRAFCSRLENRAFAFLVEVFQKLLSVVREIAQRHEQTSLLVIVVVTERPLHFGKWRVLPIPGARSLVRLPRALNRLGGFFVPEGPVQTGVFVVCSGPAL